MDPKDATQSVLALHTKCLEDLDHVDKSVSKLLTSPAPPDNATRAKVKLACSRSKLSYWRTTWDLDTNVFSKSDQEVSIWGKSGWEDILVVLQFILREADALNHLVWQSNHPRKRASTQLLTKFLRQKSRRSRNIDWAQFSAGLDRVSQTTDVLWRISELNFHSQHASAVPGSLGIDTQLDGADLTRKDVDRVLQVTAKSERLYQKCRPYPHRLELVIFRAEDNHHGTVEESNMPSSSCKSDSLSRIEPALQLLLSDSKEELGVEAEIGDIGWCSRQPCTRPVGGLSHQSLALPPFEQQSKSCIHLRRYQPSDCAEPSNLATLFAVPKGAKSYHSISLRERLGLARGLVNFVFFTLDTHWPACLTSETLMRYPDNRGLYVYRDFQDQPDSQLSRMSQVHRSLRRLAVLLLEIGLWKHITDRDISNKMGQADLLALLARYLGSGYTRACEACYKLSEFRASSAAAPTTPSCRSTEVANSFYIKELVSAFYTLVFLPFERFADAAMES